MNQVLEKDEKVKEEGPRKGERDQQQLEVTIYQIADDSMMKENRTDGTGWEWSWADWQRAWMDATPSRFAYRCLPLTIANQTGLWVNNPVAFTANWRGDANRDAIDFDFGDADENWQKWITNIFGSGIITWNTPFLFRTNPVGSRLMVSGPVNYFKDNAHPLTAIIESDWLVMSFTMNYKLMRPDHPVRFEIGEPLFQVMPMLSNTCQDLERASIRYRKLDDDPEVSRSYREWDKSRTEFTQKNQSGQLKGDDWQRDYFLGRDAGGRQLAPVHMTKVKPPKVVYDGTAKPPSLAGCPVAHGQSRPQGVELTAKTYEGPGQAAVGKVAESGRVVAKNGTTATAAAESRPSRITDEWRLWIAENLMLGASQESILDRMVAEGQSRSESASEIDQALQSPYLKAANRLQNRLKKRDWMLATYRKLNRLRPEGGAIERRERISSETFLENYYSANRPVIITGLIDEWSALKKWGLEYFSERFAARELDLRIVTTKEGNGEGRRDPYRRKMAFSAFFASGRESGSVPAFSIAGADSNANRDVLYHLLDDDISRAPEYLDGGSPLHDILAYGPAGSIIPFRQELANTLTVQVVGRRRVLYVPSWDTPLMKNLVHVQTEIDGRTVLATPPTSLGEPQFIECILEPGEVLFLPVGSWSFLEVLETSISLTFSRFACDDNDYRSFYETYQSV